MKQRLFTIKDVITGEMLMPFTEKTKKSMLRGATLMANAEKPNYLNENITDKQIWGLGTYDNETGEIVNKVEFICEVSDLLEKIKEK